MTLYVFEGSGRAHPAACMFQLGWVSGSVFRIVDTQREPTCAFNGTDDDDCCCTTTTAATTTAANAAAATATATSTSTSNPQFRALGFRDGLLMCCLGLI